MKCGTIKWQVSGFLNDFKGEKIGLKIREFSKNGTTFAYLYRRENLPQSQDSDAIFTYLLVFYGIQVAGNYSQHIVFD